jgi:hypothetical protein
VCERENECGVIDCVRVFHIQSIAENGGNLTAETGNADDSLRPAACPSAGIENADDSVPEPALRTLMSKCSRRRLRSGAGLTGRRRVARVRRSQAPMLPAGR